MVKILGKLTKAKLVNAADFDAKLRDIQSRKTPPGAKVTLDGVQYTVGGNRLTGYTLVDPDGTSIRVSTVIKETKPPLVTQRTDAGESFSRIDKDEYRTRLENNMKDVALDANQKKQLIDQEVKRIEKSQLQQDMQRLQDASNAMRIRLADLKEQGRLPDKVDNPAPGTAAELLKMMDDADATLAKMEQEWEAYDSDPQNNQKPKDSFLDEEVEDLELDQRLARLKQIEQIANPKDPVLSAPPPPKPTPPAGKPAPPKPLREAPMTDLQSERMATELKKRSIKAESENKISAKTRERLNVEDQPVWKNRVQTAKKATKILAGLGGLAALSYWIVSGSMVRATLQHQSDLNGCFLVDTSQNTRTKLKLLTCGHYDLAGAIETCTTQSWTASTAAGAITECPETTFNPCVAGSTSRSSDASVPLVPDVCSKYLYKGTKPAAITGVTTIDACTDTEGKAIPDTQACSVYCKTENFNLPDNFDLQCVSVTYPTAFADLVSALGYNPSEVFPPATPPASPASASIWGGSKALWIAAGVSFAVVLVLWIVYMTKK